jgi:hypothetical protein
MTRDSLRELEGGLVFYTARLRDCTVRGDIRDYLIARVRCWRWDGESRLNFRRPPDALLDHVWLRFSREQWPTVELLSEVEGVASVGWYARADGTADLGLRTHPAANLDEVGRAIDELFKRRSPRREMLKLLEAFLASCKPDRYGYSDWLSTAEAMKRLTSLRGRLARSEEKETAIRSTSAARGHKPRSAGRFADLLKQKHRLNFQ